MSDFMYIARPASAPRGGILVLHAWWGLNDFFKSFCNRLAAEGYFVLAPDLYYGEIAKTRAEAERLSQQKIRRDTTAKRIHFALEELKFEADRKPLAMIGFSMGAYWGLWLVNEKPRDFAASVMFYGARGSDYVKSKSAFLGHFAETDEFVAESSRKKMATSLAGAARDVSFHIYPNTQHWFFENDRPEFQAEAAELAWKRTVEFLMSHLG